MIDPVGGGVAEVANVLWSAADRVHKGGPLQRTMTAGAEYIGELEAALGAKQQYATVGQFFMDMIQGMLESGVNADTPKNEVIDGYINGWTKQQRRIEELEAEVAKLRGAIRQYGLQVCQTSGDWSLHDTSHLAEQEQARTAQVIHENIDLESQLRAAQAEVTRLKAGKLSPDEFNELCHNLHETGQPLTPCEHEAACAAFRQQLYGTPAPAVADACHEHTSPD